MDVPISAALAQPSDFLCLGEALTEDSTYAKDTVLHAWAAQYLSEKGKALIDDVVKAVSPRPVWKSESQQLVARHSSYSREIPEATNPC